MYYPGIRIKELRVKQGLSQENLAEKLGMNRVNISHYERGVITKIPSDVLVKLADILQTNTDYLLGVSDNPEKSAGHQDFTEKDEKDIAKRMEKIKQDLAADGGLSFYGEPLSEEAKESLLEAMEYAVRQAQRINKKYTPKKYREE
ncbi:helix-turn-helix transcriptional regulator [Anoxybacillus rupiensis]|uniref:Helix-turn-helix transcriptional regulator n=1 Tax=Anoxybacteroides rupiense TaxID=311460 RepID=A0ABD5IXZ3_9BACL|nr:helix-turn-helix transcriptional regulator [Anoxybacillus rupiensis]